jgi:hypothetical protein
MKRYNVLYQGRKIYQNLTEEECSNILQDFSEKFYEGEEIYPELIELEEV